MDATLQLPTATGNETIDGASLQPSIDALKSTASSLDPDVATAPDLDTQHDIGKKQIALRDRALALTGAQIDLLAGEVEVTAAHINAAAAAAKAAIADMADLKKKLVAAGKLVDFFSAVMTGDGSKMVDAAYQLKDVL